MKKLPLVLLCLLVAGIAKAQFFQRVYGTATSNDVLESGANYDVAVVTQKGYVMTGFKPKSQTAAFNDVIVTRTNLQGNVIFNNSYALTDPAMGALSTHGRRVLRLQNGQIAVWGDFFDNTSTVSRRFFYMRLNPAGAIMFMRSYTLAAPTAQVEATSITQSRVNAANIYVCGIHTSPTGQKTPVVLSLDFTTGNINWGRQYMDLQHAFEWTAEDLIESPYLNSQNKTDIALVGRYKRTTSTGGIGQGCFFLLDAATGTPGSLVHIYGNPNKDAGFNAIDIDKNPFGSGPGFMIAGYSFNNNVTAAPTYDSWAIKINPTGSIVNFSGLADYSMPFQNDYGWDIVQRQDSMGQWEYYLGGYVMNGVFGQNDEVVYKLNNAGLPKATALGNQFTYGGPGNERVLQLDLYTTGVPANNLGLSMFNWTSGSFPILGMTDFYHVRSYFNGVTCGNYNLQNMMYQVGPPLIDSIAFDTLNHFDWYILDSVSTPLQNAIICTVPNLTPPGSNARTVGSIPGGEPGSLYPNPVSKDHAMVNVQFEQPGTNEIIQIELWNALGQLCLRKNEILGGHQTLLQINLGNQLNEGLYHLVIRRSGQVLNYPISVQ